MINESLSAEEFAAERAALQRYYAEKARAQLQRRLPEMRKARISAFIRENMA